MWGGVLLELKKSSEAQRKAWRTGIQLPPPPHSCQWRVGGECFQLLILLHAPFRASGKSCRALQHLSWCPAPDCFHKTSPPIQSEKERIKVFILWLSKIPVTLVADGWNSAATFWCQVFFWVGFDREKLLLSPQLSTVSSRRQSELRSDSLPPRESGLLAWQRLQKHRPYIWGFGVCNERFLGLGTKGSVCVWRGCSKQANTDNEGGI